MFTLLVNKEKITVTIIANITKNCSDSRVDTGEVVHTVIDGSGTVHGTFPVVSTAIIYDTES